MAMSVVVSVVGSVVAAIIEYGPVFHFVVDVAAFRACDVVFVCKAGVDGVCVRGEGLGGHAWFN